MELKEWKDQSKKMFDTANDPEYLFCESVIGDIRKAVIEQFLNTKISKTDFQVLNELMSIGNYNVESSFFIIKDLQSMINDSDFKISKPNLSRSIKALCDNGFIEKTELLGVYKFLTAFKKLEELT